MSTPDKYVRQLQRNERIGSAVNIITQGALIGIIPFAVELCALMSHPELLDPFGPTAGSDGGFLLKTILVDIGIGEGIMGGAVGVRALIRRNKNRPL